MSGPNVKRGLPVSVANALSQADHTVPYALGGAASWKKTTTFDAREYGVKADGKTVSDGVITGNQLSSSAAAFTSADVGKLCVVPAAGTPVSTALSSGLTNGTPVTALPVNALGSLVAPGALKVDDGAGHTQIFVTGGAPAGATSLPLVAAQLTATTAALSTGAPITSIPVSAMSLVQKSGGRVTLVSPDFQHIQTFTANGNGTAGQTSITVNSQTPNFAFPAGTLVCFDHFFQQVTFTPNFSYPIGTTVTTMTPPLSTTISSVAGGVATLAVSAGTNIASGAEVFYATDDTTNAQACITAAGNAKGIAEFPYGHIGLSSALSSTSAVTIRGQGVIDLFGSASFGLPALNYPVVPPYLDGTVFVQCSANTDGLQLNGVGKAQHIEQFGVRFAGRFQNTGHGINSTGQPAYMGNQDSGCIGSRWDNVSVFGHDGNHYAFSVNNNMLSTWRRLHGFGGGGINFQQSTSVTSYGNLTTTRTYTNTFIAGIAHCLALQNLAGNTLDFMQFFHPQTWLTGLSNAFANTSTPTLAQFQLFSLGPFNDVGFVGPDFEGSAVTQNILWPNTGANAGNVGHSIYVVGQQMNLTTLNTALSNNPGTGGNFQNVTGFPQLASYIVQLNPLASASATTTLASSSTAASRTLVLTSAAGFSAGQAIQVDTGVSLEYAIIQSISVNTLTLNNPLDLAHNSGVTVSAGPAVFIVEQSVSTLAGAISLGGLWRRVALPIGAIQGDERQVTLVVPSGYFVRTDFANAVLKKALYDPVAQ